MHLALEKPETQIPYERPKCKEKIYEILTIASNHSNFDKK